jgi:hypothetical protein
MKITILKTFRNWERASVHMRQFIEDCSEDYCRVNTKRGCVELPNTVVYFAAMSEEKHLSLAYGAQYEYIDFHEDIDIRLKRYLQTRIRGVRK